jgi:uncharacterized protein
MKMNDLSRRKFMKDCALTAAGGLAASTVAVGAPSGNTSQIVNYNQNMEYRRQGSTDWMVSAVCLGGHSKSPLKERTEIVSRCIDAGVNYIDACSRNEVIRDAQALRGRRDKMYLALSYCGKEVREPEYRTAKKLLGSLDELLLEAGEEYTDLWRITAFEPGGKHSFETASEMVEALTKAKQQGKARAVGFSTHDRRWIQFMIEYFPEIDCVCFPFTTMSKRAQKDSLFPALKKCDVGAFGIKPFAKASLFTGEKTEDMKRARLAIRYILNSDTVVPIPGLNSMEEVDNAIKAIAERRQLDIKETSKLNQINHQALTQLPPNYQWLRKWHQV